MSHERPSNSNRGLARFRSHPARLALIALQGGTLVGAINLVDNDDEHHPEWHPSAIHTNQPEP